MDGKLTNASPELPRFQIVFISGPFAGNRLRLAQGTISIGRETGNDVELPDVTVSRRHCVLSVSDREVRISDLGSVNGTSVNGRPLHGEMLLQPGDQVDLGATLLVLQTDESSQSSEEAASRVADLFLRSTIFLPQENELYVVGGAATERSARDLKSLLGLIDVLGGAKTVPDLLKVLAQAALDALPCDRIVILLIDGASDGARTSNAWYRGAAEAVRCDVSTVAVDRILRDGTALYSNDIAIDHTPMDDASTERGTVRALLAAPLVASHHQVGILYADMSKGSLGGSETPFDEFHLQWAVAAGRIGGIALENLRRREELASENLRLRQGQRLEWQAIGDSPAIQELYRSIATAAAAESTVLLIGESGTGKEMAARAIHAGSPRANKSFVVVNCTALSEALLESDLFGHERGSFTGAIAQKKGKFEVADGGTLFLDELGELAPPLQAKLLRVLQEKVIERVGGTHPIDVDVRIVAATNRDLIKMISEGRFRADLYYRLNVVRLQLPPLRERVQDVPLLAAHFAEKCAKRARRRVRGVSEAALRILRAHDWPGNIRELENGIERAVVMGHDEFIQPEDLPEELRHEVKLPTPDGTSSGVVVGSYDDAVREAKRQILLQAFEAVSFNHQEAARLLRIHPNNLHRLIRGLDLKDLLRGRGGRAASGM